MGRGGLAAGGVARGVPAGVLGPGPAVPGTGLLFYSTLDCTVLWQGSHLTLLPVSLAKLPAAEEMCARLSGRVAGYTDQVSAYITMVFWWSTSSLLIYEI